MNIYIKSPIILCSLFFAIFESKGADHQSTVGNKVITGSFAGITAFTGWLCYKKYKPQAPSQIPKAQKAYRDLDEHLPKALAILVGEYAQKTFQDVHVSTPENPRAEGTISVEKVQTVPLEEYGLCLLVEPDEIEQFFIELKPWDTLATMQAKTAVSGIPTEEQVLFLYDNGERRKIERLEDLSNLLQIKAVQVHRKE